MATYQKPTEDLIAFNSSVFKTANESTLTLSEAQALFLGRTGTPNSTATLTSFSGSLSTQLNSTFNGVNVGKGTGLNSSVVGNGASAINDYCTSIGSTSYSAGSTSVGCATAIGYQSNASGDGAVALGFNAFAGADSVALGSNSTATANQIVLGTAGSTVICKGTTANGSLIAAADIYVNGVRAGVGNYVTNTNTCFGNGALAATTSTGLNNCGFGKDALAVISTGSANCCFGVNTLKASNTGQKNTCVGHVAGQAITGASNDNVFLGNDAGTFVNGVSSSNTFVGSQSGRSTLGTATGITALGFQTRCNFTNSTVIGIGATATAINQITLGRATETVECPGTASSISLKAATNLSVNGMVFGTGINGVGNGNIFIGQTSGTNGNGTTNTVVGHGAFTSAINTSSTGNTFIGSNAGKDITSTVTTCTIVGQGSYINTATAYNGASCLGYDCQIGGANSTAIGTGAVTGGANQIVLGRSSETVYCPGTGTSLIATKNISVNGIQVGIGSEVIGNANIYIGLGSGGSGSSNTLIGRNSWSPNAVSGNSGNTIVGAQNGFNLSSSASVSNNTVIGYNSYNSASQVAYNNICSIGVNNVVGGNQTSLLGTSTTASGNNSTAVGYGANATLGNQIMLGTSTEFVECAGTDTTNGCLKLNGGLKLQTAYGAVPSSTMLGYRIALSAIAITSLTSGTSQTIGSLALTVGVWSLNYTFELLADASVSTTQQAFFFSNQSGSSATYATRINNTGTTRFHSAITYANNDRPAYSGGGTYYASSAITLYPAINITFSTGALTGTGYASATRIG